MTMMIDPTMIAEQMLPRDTAGEPEANDVAQFTAAMSARATRPERKAIEAVQNAELTGTRRMEAVGMASPKDAESMTQAQRALLEMRSSVDLIAKVAGTLSQSINKLTTMQ
ncbi:type III secretion system major needle protein (YscF/MxiH/PrgI family) [Cupriavidus gilardii J11]|uniref:Type III secretion system major needle protein (YscF/MxiH/PrgI family) n=1 Tax=Cupriavidus gilardii J11 TaxID=936133 RepID=A0A562BJB2_9BURK|nr:type III secretion system inner rod subunit SctI [Cupriavidus gilardii]TWG84969.1 type III secretion system major needle protein (YscF/MxiH/PrgI family) [Cupriavidus gilardii J11]